MIVGRVIFATNTIQDVTVSSLGVGPTWDITKEVIWEPWIRILLLY